MVVHISPGAQRAVVLSFPRDSVVPVLSCTAEGGAAGQTAEPGQVEQINSTFSNGGPGCLWKTIEQTTHIHINDFVELTFAGFEKVINDLGGVNVCLPAAVNDPMSGLHLKRGRASRLGPGGAGLLAHPRGPGRGLGPAAHPAGPVPDVLAAAGHREERPADQHHQDGLGRRRRRPQHDHRNNLNVTRMLHHRREHAGHVKAKKVQFIEVPTETYPQNPNWVQWTTQAPQLFSAIAHDTKLPKATRGRAQVAKATLAAVSPARSNVEVLNGSGLQGQAPRRSGDLTARGFNVLGSGNAPNFKYTKLGHRVRLGRPICPPSGPSRTSSPTWRTSRCRRSSRAR